MTQKNAGWFTRYNVSWFFGQLLRFRRKTAGKLYLQFGRLGLSVCGLGLSPLVPSVRDFVLQTLVIFLNDFIGNSQKQGGIDAWLPVIVLVCLSIALVIVGIFIILSSMRHYHEFMFREPPGKINDGSISIQVQPATHPFDLIEAVAKLPKKSKVVELIVEPSINTSLRLLEGALYAVDFDEFLFKVEYRTRPPAKYVIQVNDDVYRIAVEEIQ